ncbi:hypothetical protein OAE33_02280, partial [Akkermansiaceae bacterium]|nr:hypothetical protein [Akkermansiaceae bacterium]
MTAVKEREVPSASKARDLFREGLNQWDEEKVDAATAGLARTVGAQETFDLFDSGGDFFEKPLAGSLFEKSNKWFNFRAKLNLARVNLDILFAK